MIENFKRILYKSTDEDDIVFGVQDLPCVHHLTFYSILFDLLSCRKVEQKTKVACSEFTSEGDERGTDRLLH